MSCGARPDANPPAAIPPGDPRNRQRFDSGLALMRFAGVLGLLVIAFTPPGAAARETSARCLAAPAGETVHSALMRIDPGVEELLARLTYAEGLSTGFPDDPRSYQAIAWGVMNRVRLGEASPSLRRRYGNGVTGVIFREGQFNPALSRRSPFSKHFLCPTDPARWQMATEAAAKALNGQGNPFIKTPWEKARGLSLVVNFYYPRSPQARGPLAPWENNRALEFIGEVTIDGAVLSAERIRFYRLTRPPSDADRRQ